MCINSVFNPRSKNPNLLRKWKVVLFDVVRAAHTAGALYPVANTAPPERQRPSGAFLARIAMRICAINSPRCAECGAPSRRVAVGLPCANM